MDPGVDISVYRVSQLTLKLKENINPNNGVPISKIGIWTVQNLFYKFKSLRCENWQTTILKSRNYKFLTVLLRLLNLFLCEKSIRR